MKLTHRIAATAACSLFLAALPASQRADDSLCHHKPGERLRVRLVLDRPLAAPGTEVGATLEIELLGAAAALRVVTGGSGLLAAREEVALLAGPWRAGARTRFELSTSAVGRSGDAGELRVRVEALDDFGETIQGRTAVLYALRDERGTWVSGTSRVDLELSRLAALRAAGLLDAREYERGREAASGALARTDRRPRIERPPTPAEARLEQALGTPPQELPGPTQRSAVTVVVGKVEWTDALGGTHPVPMAEVELRDNNMVIKTGSTSAAGDYVIVLGADDPIQAATIRVIARSAVAAVQPDFANQPVYHVDSPSFNISGGGVDTMNLTMGNTSDAECAFSVHSALIMIGGYTGTLTGTLPSRMAVHFPTNRATSSFRNSARELHILLGDRHDWDVIHHEYGHYVMNTHGFVNSPGGRHTGNVNESAQPGRNKDSGGRLAWGEGWPTFFGISGQAEMGGASMGIPNVGDTIYTDGEDQVPAIVDNLETSTGVGEDDEVSVYSSLWDLYDAADDGLDEFSRSDRTLFNAFAGGGVVRMGEAWSAFASPLNTRDRTEAGAVLAQAKIAPELVSPDDRHKPSPIAPAFLWKANGGGPPNPLNDFKILFYDREFDAKLLEVEMGASTAFFPSQAQWDLLRNTNDVVNWVVEGKNTSAPETAGGDLGTYWSEARRIGGVGIAFVIDDTESMVEEIAGVQVALQRFIDKVERELEEGESPPTIQVVTFKDLAVSRIVSNDLDAVRSVVSSLQAIGGGLCPESGVGAIRLGGAGLARDGILLFATDAAPNQGEDVGAMIASLRARGIKVQVILSGDCVDLDRVPTAAARAAASGTGGIQPGSPGRGGPVRVDDPPETKHDDDPPQGPISDPGQDPIDDHGNDLASATLLLDGAPPISGYVGAGDSDMFALDVEAGRPYAVRFQRHGANPVVAQLFDTDGSTLLAFATSSATDVIHGTPAVTGRFAVRMSSLGTTYTIAYREDPYIWLRTGQEVYSTIAAETGGVFALQDGVNTGETTEYVASLFNIMAGTLGPAVILAEPNDLPRASTFTLSLTGNRTNWNEDTTVDVLTGDVRVDAVEVHTPTRLQATLSIDSGAQLGFADVLVSTPVGGGFEEALGQDVVEVVEAVSAPTLLSLQPTGAKRGETVEFALFGVGTAWDASSTLDLGKGVTIDAVTAVSPTRIDARATLADNAPIAFRRATVATNGQPDDALSRALFVFGATHASPRILRVSPPRAGRGARLVVSVDTADAVLVPGVTTADLGPGVDVLAVAVPVPNRAEITAQVALQAPLGARDVTLVTSGEILVDEDAFFVDDFTTVEQLGTGLAKLSNSLDPFGAQVYAFDAQAGDVLERVFVVPFGDGSNGTVDPPDTELSVLSPTGQVLWTARSSSEPLDALDVALPVDGTYRLTVLDKSGSGGAYKGVALLAEDPAP